MLNGALAKEEVDKVEMLKRSDKVRRIELGRIVLLGPQRLPERKRKVLKMVEQVQIKSSSSNSSQKTSFLLLNRKLSLEDR